MNITLAHALEYDVTEPVAIEDLIKSLEANARLLRSAASLMEMVTTGLKIEVRKIHVTHLSQGSPLKELLAFAIYVTHQDDLEKEVPELLRSLVGDVIPSEYNTLVTVIVMLIAIYGISKAMDRIFPERGKGHIIATIKRLANWVAEITGVAVERVLSATEVLFTGRSRRVLVAASQRVLAPTRNQEGAAIRVIDGEVLVPPETVAEAQPAAGLPVEDDADLPAISTEFHQDVRIIFHAMDRDRKRLGWAGHVPSLFDERIPMHLEKALDPSAIFGKDEVMGDILLTREEDKNGDMQPKEFLLIHVKD